VGEARFTLARPAVDEEIRTRPRLETRARDRPMPPRTQITIVLARFDDLLAGGLRDLIVNDPSLVLLASDVEHKRIPVVLSAHRPDVAILDASALAVLAEIRELSGRYPATRLVLLANDPSMAECAQLLAFGASACLGRDTQSRDVLNAIHLASRGLQVIPRVVSSPDYPIAGGQRLTRREAEVLPLLQQGRSNAQIALVLQVGVETVRTHARNIFRKLGVSSRNELAPQRTSRPEQDSGPAARLLGRRHTALPMRPRRGHSSRHG
jgi:DNA-binding NarL/FixJ family response regulator